MRPTTRYVKNGNVNIAYQAFGEGPVDLVIVPGWISHLDLMWENPFAAAFNERLASFARLIIFDKRGTGLSDRVSPHELPTLEQRMDDVRAVMDAAGSKRAAVMGISEGGPMSILFAATYPERTSGLILYGSFAKIDESDSMMGNSGCTTSDAFLQRVEERWSEGFPGLEIFAPSISGDELARSEYARIARSAASPSAARSLWQMVVETDVRDVLPALRVPTLVLHRTDERTVGVAHGRYLADHIPGAKYRELPGTDHIWFTGDTDALIGEIEEFLTGARSQPDADRALATLLFADVVGSTEHAARLGDRAWKETLGRYHAIVRHEIDRGRGREVDTAGDGFFATFDGPARAVRCALSATASVAPLGMAIRAGLHTGECEFSGKNVAGIAVHTAARVMSHARPSEVLVSSTVKDLVAGSGLSFEDRGTHALKGVPGKWRLFRASA